jgi:hypothetical protein
MGHWRTGNGLIGSSRDRLVAQTSLTDKSMKLQTRFLCYTLVVCQGGCRSLSWKSLHNTLHCGFCRKPFTEAVRMNAWKNVGVIDCVARAEWLPTSNAKTSTKVHHVMPTRRGEKSTCSEAPTGNSYSKIQRYLYWRSCHT